MGVPSIALDRLRNSSSSYEFLSLITGKTLARVVITHLPMPFWVIDHFNDVDSAQNKPWLEVGKYFFHPLANDEYPIMPTYSHEDDHDSSYNDHNSSHLHEFYGTSNWDTAW